MKTSACMNEIRRIRDENSLRHLSQTPEETAKELEDSLKWFLDSMEEFRNGIAVSDRYTRKR